MYVSAVGFFGVLVSMPNPFRNRPQRELQSTVLRHYSFLPAFSTEFSPRAQGIFNVGLSLLSISYDTDRCPRELCGRSGVVPRLRQSSPRQGQKVENGKGTLLRMARKSHQKPSGERENHELAHTMFSSKNRREQPSEGFALLL